MTSYAVMYCRFLTQKKSGCAERSGFMSGRQRCTRSADRCVGEEWRQDRDMSAPGDEDVTTESGQDDALEASIARYEEVKKAIASINLDNGDSSSSGGVGGVGEVQWGIGVGLEWGR